MSEIISVENFPLFNILAQTELTADVASGATSLPVKNESGFDTDHVALIGRPGYEGAEIKTPTQIGSKSITVTVGQDHKKGTPVYLLRGHKAKIYRASNTDNKKPTSTDDYSEIGTVTMKGDEYSSDFDDSTGGSDYWYLFTYYNDIPVAPIETTLVLADAVRGGGFGTFVTVEAIREEAGFTHNMAITDQMIAERRENAESEVKGAIHQRYVLPLTYIPAVVRNATKLIAAGLLLNSSYGVDVEGSSKEGKAKVREGRAILKGIIDGSIALLGPDDQPLEETRAGFSGYPDNSAPDEEDFKFKIDQKF